MKEKLKSITFHAFAFFGIWVLIIAIIENINNGFVFNYVYQILVASIFITVLRYVCYSEDIIKLKSYLFRNILFVAVLFPFLLAFSILCNWMVFETSIIITFSVIFVIIFTITSLNYYYKYKKIGFEYNTKLEDFKKANKR